MPDVRFRGGLRPPLDFDSPRLAADMTNFSGADRIAHFDDRSGAGRLTINAVATAG